MVGVGRVFIDVLADVDDELITRYGLSNGMGVRIDQDRLTAIMGELNNPVYVAGGSVANSMSGFRALGAEATFIGKAGDDLAGKVFRQHFEGEGVRFVNPPTSYGASGCCLCLNTPDGERSFAFTVGVCEDITPQDTALSLCAGGEMTPFDVLMLETRACYDSMRDLYPRLPNTVRKVFCLHDTQNLNQLTPDIMAQVDILIGSRREVAHIMGIERLQDLRDIAEQRRLNIAVTNGEQGAVLIAPDGFVEVPSVAPDRMVDTVGAGDMFAAGYLYGLSQGASLREAGELGVRCASLIIAQAGGRPTSETAVKMKALLG